MKNKKLLTALYIILMLLPLIAVVVAYPFLPDKIPAHYGMNNQVTRWGNKSETFIFPIITIFFGFFMYIAARGAAEQEKKGSGSEKNNSTITFVAGILSIMIFDILTFYFLYADFHQVENLNDMPFSLTKISFGVLGIALIILGNIMPKLKRNSIIGLRTPWSMKNVVVWKKSQRFCGILFMLSGIIILILCFLLEGTLLTVISLLLLVSAAIAGSIYSYLAAQKEAGFKATGTVKEPAYLSRWSKEAGENRLDFLLLLNRYTRKQLTRLSCPLQF